MAYCSQGNHTKFGNRMNYTKEKTGPYHTGFSHFLCHCITDFFLSVDIQIVSLVIYARFLYHCPITDNPLSPIPANHSIILCKNGCKIGKTGCFLLFSTALQLPDTPMLPPLTPGCRGAIHPGVKDGNMGVFTELCTCLY